jgi:hypothetical protein
MRSASEVKSAVATLPPRCSAHQVRRMEKNVSSPTLPRSAYERRPEVRIEDVEVVDADAPALAEELKAHRPGLGGAVDHPRKLLAGHDRHHPEVALSLGRLKVGTDVVELAVIRPRPIWRLELEDRDPMSVGEPPDLTTEAVADPAQKRGRRGRLPEVPGDEPHHLAAHLQVRDIRVEQQPIDALDLQGDVPI